MTFEIFMSSGGQYSWHLRNSEGRLIAFSAEYYEDLDEALRCLADVQGSGRAQIVSTQPSQAA